MDKKIIFSIVIPTYNRSAFIGDTIRSVLAQTFEQFELLIVDDGSSDETDRVVASFEDKRITYFKKANGERAAARNYGVQRAQGDYITFLDSDDLLEKNHFEVAWAHLQREQTLAIFHLGYNIVDDAHNVIYRWKTLPNPFNDKLIDGNALSCLGIFMKRDIALQYPFNEDRALAGSEDYELWLRLAARYTIRTFADVTAKLVNHDTRSVLHFDPAKLTHRITLLRQYLQQDEAFTKAYAHKLNRFNALLDIYLALHLALLPGSRRQATKIMLDSFRKFPGIVLYKRFWVVVKKVFIS